MDIVGFSFPHRAGLGVERGAKASSSGGRDRTFEQTLAIGWDRGLTIITYPQPLTLLNMDP
jgi:hypothetical protein